MTTDDLGFHHRWEPGTGSPCTVLLLHGMGGTEDDLMALGSALWPGAARLAPRGAVMEDGQTRYFRRVADGVYDLQDLQRRTCDLSEFVALAAVRYGFAGNQVMALGFSNGANMAASLLFNGQEDTMRGPLLAGAALLHPRYLVEPKTLPDLKGVPIFVGAGESDPQVPWRDTQRLANWLSKAGAAVTLSRHPGVHRYTRPEIEAAIVWAKGRVPGSSEGFGSLA